MLAKERERLAGEIASNVTGKPFDPVDPDASEYWSRPVYRLRIETVARRRRNSSAGLWYVYYALLDVQKTGVPDTMMVLSMRHSASQLPGAANSTD